MLRACTEAGALPYQWVTADAAYGDIHDLRLRVAELERWYCFEVSRDSEVWRQPPRWEVPPSSGRGRPRSRPHPLPGAEAAERVDAIVRALPAEAWLRHRVAEGAKGPREYEFVRLRVVQKLTTSPGTRAG